jgi:hypothetical protein
MQRPDFSGRFFIAHEKIIFLWNKKITSSPVSAFSRSLQKACRLQIWDY